MDICDIDMLQTDPNRLGLLAVENEMKINPGKMKSVTLKNLGLTKE
jgi:hypothetical protein